jgi:hypothetical protein
MYRENCIHRVAMLASRKLHDRYIAGATAGEYVIPEELLDDAYGIERLLRLHTAEFSAADHHALAKFLAVLNEWAPRVPESVSPGEILDDPAWIMIFNAANQCLRDLSFDLSSWEEREIRPQ